MADSSPGRHRPSTEGGAANRSREVASRLRAQAPIRPLWRHRVVRLAARAFCVLYTGFRVEGLELLPAGPAVLVFSHQNWIDPIYVIAILPVKPRYRLFGPEQADMTRGFRNRLMRWSGIAIPFRPGKRGLLGAIAAATDVLAAGGRIGVAGEGRIHSGERVVLPLLEGPAYLAARAGVPLVPVAINGTSWLAFRRRVRVRFGPAIVPDPDVVGSAARAETTAAMTARARQALIEMVADFADPPRSRLIGRWLTELFNAWPEGERPAIPPEIERGAPQPEATRPAAGPK